VVIVVAHEELDWFACRLHGRSEVPRLALKLWALKRAVGDDHRGVELVEMTLRIEFRDASSASKRRCALAWQRPSEELALQDEGSLWDAG
jgi:hypothetical protein